MRVFQIRSNYNEGHDMDALTKWNKSFKTFEKMLEYVEGLIAMAERDGYTVEPLTIKEKMDLMMKPGGAEVEVAICFEPDWPDYVIDIKAEEVE